MPNIKKQTVKSGTLLIKENDVSRKLFILKKGKVRVFKNYLGGKITLATLGPGEIFGELSFFDSKPRSASVEALTDLTVHCIDGGQLSSEIESLPSWVHLIFDSVASRFRIIDQKMAVLQSMSEFQRKALSNDSVGNTIYSDMLRMIKIFTMIIHEKGNGSDKNELTKELTHTVGRSYISPKAFINSLAEYDFIDPDAFEDKGSFIIFEERLNDFHNFLKTEFEHDTCMVLGHYALGILRKALTYLEEGKNDEVNGKLVHLPSEAVSLEDIHDGDWAHAMGQLKKIKAFQVVDNGIVFDPEEMVKLFRFHTIIKSFDHTVVYE